MAILCSTNCGAAANLAAYWDACDGSANYRKYGNNFLALIKCDIAIPDPSDLTAWETAVTNGDIIIYPLGKIDIPAPSVDTSNDVDACLTNVAVRQTYTIEVSTYQTKEDYSDYSFHKNLAKNYSNYRAIWFNCEGAVTMEDDYVDFINGVTVDPLTTNPGFAFSVTAPPHPTQGDGEQTRWLWSMEIQRSAGDIFQTTLVPGLLASVQG